MSMALYAGVFKWIISKLNLSLKGEETFKAIGVLYIFGFENFQHNTYVTAVIFALLFLLDIL